MRVGTRLGAGAMALLLWSTPWEVPRAQAEPSQPCRDLAARFASAPGEMDVKDLATLASCLAAEIAARVGATGPSGVTPEEAPPPLMPPETAPPPPPQEGTSQPLTRRYGEWPTPPEWKESWPSPNPW